MLAAAWRCLLGDVADGLAAMFAAAACPAAMLAWPRWPGGDNVCQAI
jgi:hypothetical protein